ncbi:aldehyde dehydrogenase family protein [Epibacterium sp. Ofav1-8]|nr:aldehyde dehydrogenase family protein [Epibacterium sp. Ofav1-8]
MVALASGAPLAEVGMASVTDVRRAAEAAQPSWQATPAAERAALLLRVADLMGRHRDELLPWLVQESGSIPPKAAIEFQHSAAFLRAAAATAVEPMGRIIPSDDGRHEELHRVPHGVVGVISPFNFPLILSIRAIAAALATGNAVVHKPDPRTPISGGVIMARVFEEAGLPDNLLHILPGGADVGTELCENPIISKVSFTGSPGVGSKVAEACGRNLKKVNLELGGKNPIIVLEDADLDTAASNCAWGAWLHQGQICMATGKILVPVAQADKMAEALAAKARNLPVGDPIKGDCALGPLIAESEAKRIEGIVEDAVTKGATCLVGGTADGKFFPATVLFGVTPEMRAFHEVVFGPLAIVVAYDDLDQAEVAHQMGVSQGQYSKVVAGRVPLAPKMEARMKAWLERRESRVASGDQEILEKCIELMHLLRARIGEGKIPVKDSD